MKKRSCSPKKFLKGLLFSSLLMTIGAQGDFFEELFKDVNFDELLKELEEDLKKAEAERKETKVGDKGKVEKPADAVPVAPKKPRVKKDPDTLFLDPDTDQQKLASGKIFETPTDETFKNFQRIKNEFLAHLNSIDQKVTSPVSIFPPNVKEKYHATLGPLIDDIIVALEIIESKKVYTQLLLAPPEAEKQLASDMKALRKEILDLGKSIEALDKQIYFQAEAEEEEVAVISTLQDLANPKKSKPKKELEPLPLEHKKRGGKMIKETDSPKEKSEPIAPSKDEPVQLPEIVPAYKQQDPLNMWG